MVIYCTQSLCISQQEHTSDSDLLIVPHCVNTVTASNAFHVASPTIWNNLPAFVKVADSFNVFMRCLKSYLCDTAF